MDNRQIRERIINLYGKWQNQTISPDELFELKEWLSINDLDPVEIPEEFAASASETEQRILHKIKESRPKVVDISIRRRVIRWAVAASVLLAGFIIYKLLPSDHLKNNNAQVAMKEIAPGQDRAILQMADGTKVILDNTPDGKIINQQNIDITKNGGAVVYNSRYADSKNADAYNTMSTPRGGQYKLKLSDGTIVWLNAASEIKYPMAFNGKERVVELTGEAYFEVAKDESKPFHVKVRRLNVDVLGTHFNINAYKDENNIDATLLEGSINVNIINEKPKRLIPGQQARVLQNGNEIVVNNVDVDEVVSWQRGIFQFRNAGLNVIARQLSRWYDVDISTEGNINKKLGGGISKKSPLSQILILLQKYGVQNRWENNKIILTGE